MKLQEGRIAFIQNMDIFLDYSITRMSRHL